ncbi:MAG: hypothetical protein RLY86_4213 [Pseudomonadota bacterium]|jgi:nucleoid-associated protein YgaU
MGIPVNRSQILWPVLALAVVLLLGVIVWRVGSGSGDTAGPSDSQASAPKAPATPVPETAPPGADGVPAPAAPSFDVVRIEADGTAVLAGRAAPGATVRVLDGDRLVGTVTADSNGEWVLIPETPLAPGNRELTVEAEAADGTVLAGAGSVVLMVPERGRSDEGEAGPGALAVLTPAQGAARVLQAPPAGEVLPADAVAVDAVGYDRDGVVSVGGRAAPGSTVMLYLDNTLVGRATADTRGRWEATPDRRVGEGRYALRADQTDAAGAVASRAEVTFDRRAIPETGGATRAVVILPGNNLWTIAQRKLGGGQRYTTIFAANQDQIRDPNLIYPGQIFIVPEGQ